MFAVFLVKCDEKPTKREADGGTGAPEKPPNLYF